MSKLNLYDWQKEAISKLKDHNALLCVPTGEGKTAVAKEWADLDNASSVIFTAPIKSISNERYFELLDDGYNVGLVTGDCVINPHAPILCMTQEIYTERYAEYEDQKVIFDEIGYIGRDPDRQQTYFDGLSKTPESSKVLCMSATIGNIDELRLWLERAKNEDPFVTYESNVRHKGIEMHKSFDFDTNYIEANSLVFDFSVKGCEDIAYEIMQDRKNTPSSMMNAGLRYLQDGGQFDQDRINKMTELLNICGLSNKFDDNESWREQLLLGVGIYHGKMDFNEKIFIETAMKTGLIDVVVGTDALALGVNLPCKNTYIMDDYKAGMRLSNSDIIQMAGRAGRDRKYEKGHVYLSTIFDWGRSEWPSDVTALKADDIPLDKFVRIPGTDTTFGAFNRWLNKLSRIYDDPVLYIIGKDENADYNDYEFMRDYFRAYGEEHYYPYDFERLDDTNSLKRQLVSIGNKYDRIHKYSTEHEVELSVCTSCIDELQSFMDVLQKEFYIFPEINDPRHTKTTENAFKCLNAIKEFITNDRTDYKELAEIIVHARYRFSDSIAENRHAFSRGLLGVYDGVTLEETNGNNAECLEALYWCMDHAPQIEKLISDMTQHVKKIEQAVVNPSRAQKERNKEYAQVLRPYLKGYNIHSVRKNETFEEILEETVKCFKYCFDLPIREQQDKYEGAEQLMQNVHDFVNRQKTLEIQQTHNGILDDAIDKSKHKEQTSVLCLEAVRQDGRMLRYVKDQTPEICLAAVKQNGCALKYVKEQTPEICLEAVRQNGFALEYVKEQNPEICLAAVRQNWKALQYVKEQTRDICLAAVKQDGLALYYVRKQTDEIRHEAVRQNGNALAYVNNQTDEICLEAVKQNGLALKYVHNKTPEICLTAVRQAGKALEYVDRQTPEICFEAVKQNGMVLYDVEDQTPEICLAAVKQNGNALAYVKNQTPELCLEAVKEDGRALRFVKEQTPEICLAAVRQAGSALQYVPETLKTPELILEAVRKNGYALEYVESQTDEICLEALKQNGLALNYVKNQTLSIALAALRQNPESQKYLDDRFCTQPVLAAAGIWNDKYVHPQPEITYSQNWNRG